MPLVPFATVLKRDIHFIKHGHEFGAATATECEQMADAFMFGAINADTHECITPSRQRRKRMNFTNVHFGAAIIVPSILLTFYIPRPDTVLIHGGVANLHAHYCMRDN